MGPSESERGHGSGHRRGRKSEYSGVIAYGSGGDRGHDAYPGPSCERDKSKAQVTTFRPNRVNSRNYRTIVQANRIVGSRFKTSLRSFGSVSGPAKKVMPMGAADAMSSLWEWLKRRTCPPNMGEGEIVDPGEFFSKAESGLNSVRSQGGQLTYGLVPFRRF